MGFWQTGYMEFHEPITLPGFEFSPPPPPTYPCCHCNNVYDTRDELRQHRFEAHPHRRPPLYICGIEVGSEPRRITRPLREEDVRADGFDVAVLNGRQMPAEDVAAHLTQVSTEVCKLTLRNAEVSVEFVLDFCIAEETHLLGVETEFENLVRHGHLDTRTLDEFILRCQSFSTATRYYDGVCSYLYGVLAKEGSGTSSLPHASYTKKFNSAAHELRIYDRPLARHVCALIEFHYNHFSDVRQLAPQSRVGSASTRFATRNSNIRATPWQRSVSEPAVCLEQMLTDQTTEQVIRWAICDAASLVPEIDEMQSWLSRARQEYDRVKLSFLLAEANAAAGQVDQASRLARSLRNIREFAPWAESVIDAS